MNTPQVIKIGKGLNDIRFGIYRETLKKTLGEPTEIEQLSANEDDDEDEYFVEVWHYDEMDLSFSFDEEDDWRLMSIAANSDEMVFNGKNIKGISLAELKELVSEEELGEMEEEMLDDNQKVVSILSSSINFWFENDALTEVQWGVLWTNEDIPKWP
ncbi:MAG: hypothetical protein KDE33_15675 [Bacteroidetes bacterium]|nr:hypothetical protein [Bacteroidota bacterium]MCB9334610.1 hypothetical protein [Flavobacteriales bacterium]